MKFMIKTRNTFRNYALIALLLMVCLVPVVYKELLSEDTSYMRIVSSVVYTLPLCIIVCALKNRLITFALATTVMVTSFLETMMVLLYGEYLTAGNIIAMLDTTPDEGGGFVMSTLHEVPFALPVVLFFVCTIPLMCQKRSVWHLWKSLLCSVLLMAGLLTYLLQSKWGGQVTARFYIEQNVCARPPYNFWFQVSNVIEQKMQRALIADAQKMSFSAKKLVSHDREYYVLAIGESLRYSSLSIAGYNRETTPLLATLDSLVLFSNYYSTANLTMYSVPQIVTRATPDDYSRNFSEKSIVAPFKECGFHTFVITPRNLLGYEEYLTNGRDSLFNVPEYADDRIAEIIDSLTNVYDKAFFIVQFKGNHSPYNNFKKEQDKYHPNPVTDNVPWTNHEAMVNAYDNTVLFTDYNVYNIIKAIDKQNSRSALLMVSDHGADYDTGVSDHGGNCNPHKAEYHVPLMVWYNAIWSENNMRKIEAMRKNKDCPVNADNVFYSVCDMADIQIAKQYAKPEWSIFNPKLEQHERRLLVPDGRNTIVVK